MSGKGVLAKRATSASTKKGGLSSLFQIYTDDTPGIKVGPTTVLILSLMFMGAVVVLHIFSKLKAVVGTSEL